MSMASYKSRASVSRRKTRSHRELSPGTKKALIAGAACVVILIAGLWAFDALTIPKPPDLKTATPDQQAEFLASRGYSRMSIPEREEYLGRVVEYYTQTPERTEALNRAFERLSFSEQQRFIDATFDVAKDKVLKASDEYLRTPPAARAQFTARAMQNLEAFRRRLGAAETPDGNNLATPFKNHIPQRSEAWTRAIVDRTNPAERAKAKPFIDDLARQYELKRQRERSRRTG